MNSHSQMETEQTIQRLVDNQLDDQQRARFLQIAERQPELWRQLALAFIEEQVWSTAIGRSADADSRWPAGPGVDRTGRHLARGDVSRHRKPWLLALAAATLLALTVAIRMAVLPGSPRPVDPVTMPLTGLPSSQLVSSEQPYMLQMNDHLQVPLYQGLTPLRDHMARQEPQLDPTWQEFCQVAGLQVRPDVRYITGSAPDGRSFVVPVQQYRFQPTVQ